VATSLTRNLKLKVDSNLSANAKYNLERIDALGAVYLLDNTETVNIRSKQDITLRPNDASVGGSGSGGSITLGASGQQLDAFTVYATAVSIGGTLQLDDQASGGNKKLGLQYKSDINGSTDTSANRTLAIDVDGADRNLVLGGNLSVTGGSLSLSLSGSTSLTLPLSGTLSTLSGAETLTNKVINASSNTLSNISDTNISASAAIAYSKLALTGQVVNADISSSAAIAYSKLALTSSITNSDISGSAAIAYSKLALTSSVVDSDISPSAAIGYSKLALTASIVNADIASGAAISRTKIATGSASHVIVNDGSGNLSSEAALATSRGGTGVSSSATYPTSGVVLTDSNSAVVTGKTLSGNDNTFSNIGYASLSLAGGIVNADISASAAIAYSKLSLAGRIVDADVSASAAIAGTKVAPDFGNQKIRTLVGLEFEEGGYKTLLQAATGGQSADLTLSLPPDAGTNGQVLQTNGSGELSWVTVAGTGTVTSVDLAVPAEFTLSGNPITTAGTITIAKANQNANLVYAGPSSGGAAQPTFRSLAIADLPSSVVRKAATNWVTADGTTKVFVHNLGTTDVVISTIDESNNVIFVDAIAITDSNTVTLTATEAPATSWRVIVIGA
jgi:hypothetical protein